MHRYSAPQALEASQCTRSETTDRGPGGATQRDGQRRNKGTEGLRGRIDELEICGNIRRYSDSLNISQSRQAARQRWTDLGDVGYT